jgi:ABC-type antimicrobial peptide transport system permease subunit
MALGASRAQVFRSLLGQGLATTAIGVAAGIVAALGLTRTIESLLFGVTATDPVTFAAVVGLMTLMAIVACCLPGGPRTPIRWRRCGRTR